MGKKTTTKKGRSTRPRSSGGARGFSVEGPDGMVAVFAEEQ